MEAIVYTLQQSTKLFKKREVLLPQIFAAILFSDTINVHLTTTVFVLTLISLLFFYVISFDSMIRNNQYVEVWQGHRIS